MAAEMIAFSQQPKCPKCQRLLVFRRQRRLGIQHAMPLSPPVAAASASQFLFLACQNLHLDLSSIVTCCRRETSLASPRERVPVLGPVRAIASSHQQSASRGVAWRGVSPDRSVTLLCSRPLPVSPRQSSIPLLEYMRDR